jgi:Spy/CpxP family protein refolding chaperone
MTLKRTLLTLCMLLSAAGFAAAQNPQPAEDPIQQLNLTPEQRQRIRILTEQTRDERQQTNRRLREANIALDQALDAEPVDDNLVEQRINELTAAQGAQTRLRIHMELRIRRLLSAEQLATLKQLRLQLRDVIAPQRQNNKPRRPNADAFRPNPRRP